MAKPQNQTQTQRPVEVPSIGRPEGAARPVEKRPELDPQKLALAVHHMCRASVNLPDHNPVVPLLRDCVADLVRDSDPQAAARILEVLAQVLAHNPHAAEALRDVRAALASLA